VEVNLKFDELGCYRKDGNIQLDHLINSETEKEREVRGNQEREKDWFTIRDGRVMFKSNSEHQQQAHYSELICTYLAKQIGRDAAEYDFAVYKGEQGVITKDVCKEGEELLTINDLIGDGPTNPDYPDNTDICFVFDSLKEKFVNDGYSEQDIDKCMLDLRKQLLFDLYVMETDRHVENISFIISKDRATGKPTIRLAPMYDTEAALAICDDPEQLKKLSEDILKVSEVTNMLEPKMCVMPEVEDEVQGLQGLSPMFQQLLSNVGPTYGSTSEGMWKETLDFLCEDRRAFEYVETTLNNMDIRKAIDALEQDKDCKIPDGTKSMAIAAFEDRKSSIAYELGLDMSLDSKKEKTVTSKELT